MCGLGEIDINDWRKHTNYRGEYGDKHHVIVWFWKVSFQCAFIDLKACLPVVLLLFSSLSD